MPVNPSAESAALLKVNRREAIRRVSALLGGIAFVGGSRLLAALDQPNTAIDAAYGKFSAEDIAFLDEVAETILPATKTPGAKAAKTGAFIAVMVTDTYNPAQQKVFREGMRKVDEAAQANQVSFMAATPEQRLAVLDKLDREQKRVTDARAAADRHKPAGEDPEPPHYFRMIKELTLLGYFTSEVGCTQALRYMETPGRYDACLPYAPGEPAWASHA
jgi:hypothetical protein